jgi:hypothetical protein
LGCILISSDQDTTGTRLGAAKRFLSDREILPGILLEWLAASEHKVGPKSIHRHRIIKTRIEIV